MTPLGEEQRQRLLSMTRFGGGGIEADLTPRLTKIPKVQAICNGSLRLDVLGVLV